MCVPKLQYNFKSITRRLGRQELLIFLLMRFWDPPKSKSS